MSNKSIIPPTGEFGTNWPGNFNLPQGASGYISAGGWTYGNEGFIQQTFLGASVRNFNINAAFGNSTSTLSVNLIEDEYNVSDRTGFGLGDDVYHNGTKDNFIPPAVGSPVFFKFGKRFATVEQAWRPVFDEVYNTTTVNDEEELDRDSSREFPIPLEQTEFIDLEKSDRKLNKYEIVNQPNFDNSQYSGDRYSPANKNSRGLNHIIFGGILQSYVQTKGSDGNPLYSVQVVDPREILSNSVVILNNYAGSIFNNKNYFNVYGFLEYDISESLKSQFDFSSSSFRGFNLGPIESSKSWVRDGYTEDGIFIGNWAISKTNNVLKKIVDNSTGSIYYVGNDMYRFAPAPEFGSANLPEFFPITGQGFSRRSEKGIPWYRVRQALNALFNYNGALPQEYIDKGFGGPINFRGYNYVVDFGGIPIEKIPQMYFLDFDQIDLLSLCQELCEIISHDLFITLLPIINHESSGFLFEWNNYYSQRDSSKVIAGIIRVDAIDRSKPPQIGVIKDFLDSLQEDGIPITNQDLGYELANITTDKIVAGAQEVDMYFFNSNKIRDNLQLRKFKAGEYNAYEELQSEQWSLETSLKQQILPFYGFLGKNTPTIPIGFGAYQQILLDASSLEAYGVGNYYVATEMELRAALISYDDWVNFLIQYNEVYIEELTEDKIFWQALNTNQPTQEFGVSVPRCVFISERNGVDKNGYPLSPCSPPYGYPLYYKRAERIGVPQAGILKIQNQLNQIVTNLQQLQQIANERDGLLVAQGQAFGNAYNFNNIFGGVSGDYELNQIAISIQSDLENVQRDLYRAETAAQESIAIRKILKANQTFIASLNSLASESQKNAKKVYDFIRNIAEKHLGKTFLVKIPVSCNVNYSSRIQLNGLIQVNDIVAGPYGFKPIPINSDISQFSKDLLIYNYQQLLSRDFVNKFEHYLNFNINNFGQQISTKPIIPYTHGALKSNFSPISDNWEFNYKPEPQGGFFNYNLFDRNISFSELSLLENTSAIPLAQSQLLAPLDLGNFQSNSRVKPYVRFDHSEYLDFSAIGKQNISQQIITANGFIPDVLEELNNVNIDSAESFNQIQKRLTYQSKPPSVAFVTCEIDDQFYLIPNLQKTQTLVYARIAKPLKVSDPPSVVKTIEEYDLVRKGCPKYEVKPGKENTIWVIPPNGGIDGTFVERLDYNRYYNSSIDSNIIQTEKESLNNQHVYAVITLPDRVMPTIDQRYLDGPLQVMNGASIKHTLTIDVVRGAPGFNAPRPLVNNASINFNCDNFTLEGINSATRAQQAVWQKIGFVNPAVKIGFAQPSPVYPDLVVLPLISMERCYGPWISSSIFNGQTNYGLRYSDIGGKVEFVKDENLAPWNFAGYQLMNEAGALQAQFSNSLMLFSERGGFTIPDIPRGIILARPLSGKNGPLITSIGVDVADNSVQTIIKMDLYTSRFGKLQKQKEDAIGKIARERQKIIDQNNLITRKNLLKSTTLSRSFDLATISSMTPIPALANRGITHLFSDQSGAAFLTIDQITSSASVIADGGAAMFASAMQKTGSTPLSEAYQPFSHQPSPNMASKLPTLPQAQLITRTS